MDIGYWVLDKVDRTNRKAVVLFLAVIIGFVVSSCTQGPDPGGKPASKDPVLELSIGFMICDGIEETKRRFEPLVAYLSENAGVNLIPVYLNTFEVPEAFEKGELDITHTNSLLYVIMHEKGLLPLAGEKRGSMGYRSAGAIVVRSDSPVRKLSDLKDKRMVFGPQLAPMGFLSQYELLLDAGVDPEVDLELYAIPWGSYKHEKVIYGVWMGAYDAAAVPLLDLEDMVRDGRIGKDDLRIIAQGDPIPYCVFGVSPEIGDDIASRIRSALLNVTGDAMARVDGEDVKVLKAALVDGFVPIEDQDFERVREMAKKTNMPPYQTF